AWVRDESVVVRDEAGRPQYWQGLILDITARKEAEAALRASEASLAEAQRIAHLGSWEHDPNTGATRWSDEIYRILELAPRAVVPSYPAFLARIHPEDRAGVERAVQTARTEGRGYDHEYRVTRPGGPDAPAQTMAVNFSPRQFLQPDLVEEVAAILRETGLPPASLRLELTESVAMAEPLFAGGTLQALRALGVQLAIDDFGTGYSS